MIPKLVTRRWRLALIALMCSLLFAATPAGADLIETVDEGTLAGTARIDDQGQLSIAQPDGEATALPLYDVHQITFGKGIVIRGGDIKLVDNDGLHTARSRSGSIKLRAGLHHIVLPYWQSDGQSVIELRVDGPGFDKSVPVSEEAFFSMRRTSDEIPQSAGVDGEGYRQPELALSAIKNREVRSRLRYRFYSGENAAGWRDMSCFSSMTLKRQGTVPEIANHVNGGQEAWYGVIFEGFIRVSEDGEYTFTLLSDDGSQLYFGQPDQFNASLPIQTEQSTWRAELRQGGGLQGDLKNITEDIASLTILISKTDKTDLGLSLNRVSELWRADFNAGSLDRSSEAAGQDTAYIRGKEEDSEVRPLHAKVMSLDEQSLTVVFRGQERQINRDRVMGLVLNHADRPAPPPPGYHQTLALRTGQQFAGRVEALTEQAIRFTLLGGQSFEVPRESLAYLRNQQGRVIDLTQVQPTAVEDIPYFDTTFPYRVNQAIGGGDIRLYNGKNYERGLSVHSLSRLHYRLDGQYKQFRATVGLLEPTGRLGNVTVRVRGDGEVLWEQENVTRQSDPIQVSVDLTDVKRLILEVDFGQGQNVGDRAAWCDPQLIRDTVSQ